MDNPFDPIKEKQKHRYYNNGYKVGLRGWIYREENKPEIKRTSWSQGYLAAVNRRKLEQLILGNKNYDHNYIRRKSNN